MSTRVLVTGWVAKSTPRGIKYQPDVDMTNVISMGAIKLRGNPIVDSNALCLVILDYAAASRLPTRDPDSITNRLRDLGEDTETTRLSTAVTSLIASDLGISAPARASVGELIVLYKGAALKPLMNNRIVISINGHLLHEQSAISGGATDAFTYSNGLLSTVSSGVWVNGEGSGDGGMSIVSNAVASPDIGSNRYATAYTTNHYSEADVTIANTNYVEVALDVRRSTSDFTLYEGLIWSDGAGIKYDIGERAAGTYTQLTTGSTSNGRFRMAAEGSALRLYRDDVLISNTTDTTLTTQTHVGIQSWSNGPTWSMDNWEGGDLGANLVQSRGINGVGADPTLAFLSTLSANSILVLIAFSDGVIETPTDSASHVWELRASETNGGTVRWAVYTAPNVSAGGTPTVTLNTTSSSAYTFWIAEVSGALFHSCVDSSAFGTSISSGATTAMTGDGGLGLGAVASDTFAQFIDTNLTTPTSSIKLNQDGAAAYAGDFGSIVLNNGATLNTAGTSSGTTGLYAVALAFSNSLATPVVQNLLQQDGFKILQQDGSLLLGQNAVISLVDDPVPSSFFFS